jgi:ankyrin repeat protein
MGSGASTATSVLPTVSLDDQELSLDEVCRWVQSQNAGPVGDVLVARCRESGLSAAEILLHMDQETLLTTLQTHFSDAERRHALDLIHSGRKALRREYHVTLKELPDAMDRAVYVHERFPLVLDPSGQATRFLKYQRGAFLMVGNPKDMAPENLRRHLVGALRHGTWLVLDFDSLNTLELDQFFASDSFPQEIFSRQAMCRPEVYEKLLRVDDPDPAEFMVNDQFKFVVLCRTTQPPPKTALAMCVLHVHVQGSQAEDSHESSLGENGALAKALGVGKEVKRNSLEIVEAAFDNDLDVVQKCLEKNYDIESADGHGHTSLSEASCQGHTSMVRFLLERGADPNHVNDERRSALYRAAYNGHVETVQLLLESGADPRIATKHSETAFDVAKTQGVQDLVQRWDISNTETLLERRREIIEQKWQERISTHVERERHALLKIHDELVQLAHDGDAVSLEARLEQLVEEALASGEKPRATVDVRDEKGSTLLAIAAQFDHAQVVMLLVSKWKEWKELAVQSASRASNASVAKELTKKPELMAKVFKANVNARDGRGWTPVAIAVFHESKKSLRMLLDNGADPKLRNQYNKNAFDFAKDDIDAALNVVKSRAEVSKRSHTSAMDRERQTVTFRLRRSVKCYWSGRASVAS